MNEEMTGKCLRQVEHICGHFSVAQIFHNGQPSHGGADHVHFRSVDFNLTKGTTT